MFETRHYWQIAGVLATSRGRIHDRNRVTGKDKLMDEIEENFVKLFKEDNPNFKPERFIAA